MGDDDDDRGGDDDTGGGHYNESSGITPPSASIAITSGTDPSLQYALCIAISARGHSRSASPRKKDQAPFLVVATPPLVHLRLPPLICLSFASMAGCCVTFCRVTFTLRRTPPFPVHSTHGSIAVAPFASP